MGKIAFVNSLKEISGQNLPWNLQGGDALFYLMKIYQNNPAILVSNKSKGSNLGVNAFS